ncbi:hypothetical protein QJQ45_003878 [Haematococcus lacustris]|nr:hypothetical protein QJQ45_003878 [Haematococcus lacustris]
MATQKRTACEQTLPCMLASQHEHAVSTAGPQGAGAGMKRSRDRYPLKAHDVMVAAVGEGSANSSSSSGNDGSSGGSTTGALGPPHPSRLEEEHTTEPAGPDPGLQHTPVSPVLGPALQLQHTPRGPGQGLQQQQQHTPMAPAPGPTPALHLQVTPSYRSPPGALEKASSSSSNTPLWPLPMSCSYSSPPGALAKANGCSVEEVASMGQGQVEKRAKTALALHAQDKSDIMNNDALVSFLHHMQVLELPVTNTVFKAVYSAVNGQGFVCSVSRMER